VDNEGLAGPPLKAEIGLEGRPSLDDAKVTEHMLDHRGAAFSRTGLRRAVSVIGGRLLRLLSLLVLLTVPVMLIALIIWSLPLLRWASLGNLLGMTWNPEADSPAFGFTAFVVGSLAVTSVAMLIAVPISLFSAVYLAYYVRERDRHWLRPLVELLAGIPSVVYGLWGILVVVPLVRSIALTIHAEQTTGYSLITAALVLALMVTPFMIALMEEIVRATPKGVRNAALALGATKWEVVRDVLFRQSRRGLIAAIGLGFARALGETLAVIMLVGNKPQIPTSLLDGVSTLPGLIANNFGELLSVPMYYSALMFAALLLLIMVLLFNLGSHLVIHRMINYES
jgi:phosphate transport system permease protein